MYRVGFIAVALLSLTLMFAAAAAVNAETVTPGITVTGSADAAGKPDVAYVTLGVTTEDKVAATAARDNASQTAAVIEAIVKSGVTKDNIQTSQYSVSPIVNYESNPPVTTGYRVSNQVRATVRDLDRVGGLIDAAMTAGANVVRGVTFDIENPNALRQQALVAAMKSANADAVLIAQTLGVKLGRPTSASMVGPVGPRPYDMPMMKMDAVSTPIVPGNVTVSASITVVYSIL